jgi:hypothetical protein
VGSSGRPSFAARRLPWAAAALVAKPLGEAAPDGGPAHGLRQLVVLLPGGFPPLLPLGFLPRLAEDVPRPLPQGLASPLCRDRWLGVVSRGRLGGSLAHYSQRWPLRTSPSCRVFNNAMSLISLTLQMAPLRGRWPTSPGRPSCPAPAEGPGGAAAGGWCPAGETTDGDVPRGMPCGRAMRASP